MSEGLTESKNFKYARLLGFDYIKGQDGQFWLIEVNDTPAQLSTLKLFSNDGGITINSAGPSAIEKIASVLASPNEDGVAVILRPFSLDDSSEKEDENDIAEIIAKVKALGRECVVVTPKDLDQSSGLSLRDGKKIASVYRKTHVRADCAPRNYTINPAITAAICRDKLLTHSVLSLHTKVKPIPTAESPTLIQGLQDSDFYIRKPRFGSASKGISRFEASQISAQHQDEEYVWQPWIEPDTVEINGRPYYYDIRIISFDGEVVGSYARCSAAPVGGVAKNLDLEWLTTLGHVIPVWVGDRKEHANSVMLSRADAELIKQSVRGLSYKIEKDVSERANCSLHSNNCISPADRSTPVLYVCGGSGESQSTASCEAILATQSLIPSPVICNVSALNGDWDELASESGWGLMPQLFVGNEFFVGSHVIGEAVKSGEISRAITKMKPAWASEVVEDRFFAFSDIKHRAEVWALCSTPQGEVKVSSAADGTIRIDNGDKVLFYSIDSCWLNSISISPCGQNLVIGTSKADIFAISLAQGSIEKVLRLKGHSRWVNGVVALDNHRIISVSSDGVIALWINGVLESSVTRGCFGGHVLGMTKSHREHSVIIWSSDGLVSEVCSTDLMTKFEWRAPTKSYVTAACEALIDGKWGLYAVDMHGMVYCSQQSSPVFSVNNRAWGMSYDASGQRISIATVDGTLFIWDGDSYRQAIVPISCSSPTVCRYTPNGGALMIGFASGDVCIC
ncbi:hypothetical protein [Pseudomonas sp. 8BK]|uniref:hypothetical protein n=1 Tax=Pseudomonas sp. 8BK TaxID=2653164 RepID=UPI001358FDFF|nr:hypothetical protein [Pseudomonas sp. 8BK]